MIFQIPNISLGKFGYEGTITLDAWDGFLTRKHGVYGLDFGGDMVVQNPTIEEEHVATYHYLIENQTAIRESILEILVNNYKNLQDQYGYEGNEAVDNMPNVTEKDDFRSIIGLLNVHIMNVYKDGLAYFGLEFDCTWDEEHGFGVMMYKDRVVEIGGADTSCLTWVAERDKK